MSTFSKYSYDIILVGGGLASSLLSIRLKQECPELSICIIEKKIKFHKKVGESTSDLAAMYFRRFGIDHLLSKHIEKSGLRFIFKDGSEFSSPSYRSIANGFQIDRSIFDEDLLVEASKLGVEVLRGATYLSIESKPTLQTIKYELNACEHIITSKWVVDASGKAGVIAKKLNWITSATGLNTASSWAHFENITPMKEWDKLDSSEWDTKAIGPREHSTCHFMGEGYWWWYIPLADGTYSIGVVYDTNTHTGKVRDIFEKLKGDHPLLRIMLSSATFDKLYHYPSLSYAPKQVFQPGVVAIGDVCMFPDPLFSPGMELVTQQVEWVQSLLISSIKHGYKKSKWDKYQRMIKSAAETRLFVYHNRYKVLNNFRSFSLWTYMDFLGYYWFHVLPAAYFPRFLKYPVRLNSLTKFIYQNLVKLYVSKKIQQEKSEVLYSKLWIPKKRALIPKYIELFYLWFRYLIQFLLK